MNALLGGNRRVLVVESRLQRVPGQRGAFNARGKFGDTREDLQLAEIRRVGHSLLTSDETVELREELFGLGPGFSLEHLRHHGSGSARDGAAGTLERNVANRVTLHVDVDRAAVAAKGIVALGMMI